MIKNVFVDFYFRAVPMCQIKKNKKKLKKRKEGNQELFPWDVTR